MRVMERGGGGGSDGSFLREGELLYRFERIRSEEKGNTNINTKHN